VLFGGAVLVCLLSLPALASAETAPGSTESLVLSASYRELGKPTSVTVEGMADGLHRLFVYGEAEGTCTPWPYEEPNQKAAVWLSSPEGEPLGAGPFSKTYIATPAKRPSYDVCAYLDTTPSGLPDDFEWGCFWIPEGDCYFPNVTARSVLSTEEEAKKIFEEAEAERKHRAEAEQAKHRAAEEAAAHQASEEAARRHAIEEAERQTREAKSKWCMVPQLHRHTLAGVRRLLRDANCRLGRVTTRHHGHGSLVVQSQSPEHGKTLTQGSAVSVALEPGTA
jgi:hypothetical protein